MRAQGWESRLAGVLEQARAKPYELGVHDCFRTACAVVAALTGVDRWPEFAGRYRTERESRRVLAAHGRTFRAAFDGFFGAPAIDVKLARRGDIAAWADPDGEQHLAVVDGARAWVLGPGGLLEVPLLACSCAWRVG